MNASFIRLGLEHLNVICIVAFCFFCTGLGDQQVKLDCGSKVAALSTYCESEIGYCSDFGTESQFTEARG